MKGRTWEGERGDNIRWSSEEKGRVKVGQERVRRGDRRRGEWGEMMNGEEEWRDSERKMEK
jgi:hypothetical protein